MGEQLCRGRAPGRKSSTSDEMCYLYEIGVIMDMSAADACSTICEAHIVGKLTLIAQPVIFRFVGFRAKSGPPTRPNVSHFMIALYRLFITYM